VYDWVPGLSDKLKTQLLAWNSNITYAGVFGPNYKLNAQLLACNSTI
jgi:hypothetical protein